LKELYPTAPHAEVLNAIPSRNWKAITSRASRDKIKRLHRDRMVNYYLSLYDSQFLEEMGGTSFTLGKWEITYGYCLF
jgi:hypothetical protein